MSLAVMAILIFVITFLLGSIPFGVIVSRLFFKKDIRSEGSGNIGTTNAMRSLGKVGGASVFLLDFGKGLLSGYLGTVFMNMAILTSGLAAGQFLLSLAFLGCIVGHIYSPWLKFHGGKGIAVAIGACFFTIGVFFSIVELLVFAILVVATRYVSVGSIAAALICPPIACYLYWGNIPVIVAITIAALLIIYAHRENIKRLLNHNENRIGSKKKEKSA
ncbi:glycerol-3-phosphate 1-O-acyltransferase PlsY [Anaerotardibacter muris]|uniref:glycerol-3-phosphate 1-O-acyltransferase PlsY n=1 Tax=Anaerotardibacter muris TaxID=2941505 RepID=UPI00204115AB|nr:glycerol-3-phosphate 1-O-acyltransferase PlsY [Anaerotardibacter muris]